MTLEDFLAMPGIDERRLELIDGEVYEAVSPQWLHARMQGILWSMLERFGYAGVEARTIIPARGDRGPSAPLPDVAFFRRRPPATPDWLREPPHVVVEIVSPGQSRAEVRAKVDIYRDFGVESIWVVDIERRTFDVYERGGRVTFVEGERLRSAAIPGLAIAVTAIFEELDSTEPRGS